MLSLLFVAATFVFPAVAVWAFQSGGSRRLFQAAGGASAFAIGAGLLSASKLAGNRLVEAYGYTYTAVTNVAMFTLVAVLPIVVTAMIVRLYAKRLSSGVLLIVAAISCFLTLLIGTMAMVYLAYAV